jgi:hypothetical protein
MAKGNDGSAARRRTMRKLLIAAIIALMVTFLIIFNDRSGSGAKSPSHSHRKTHNLLEDESSFHNRNHGEAAETHRKIAQKLGGLDRMDLGGPHSGGDSASGDGHGNGRTRKWAGKAGKFPSDLNLFHHEADNGNGDHGIDANASPDEIAARYKKDLINSNKSSQKAEEALEGILNGSINLADISGGYGLKSSNDGSYHGISGQFCKLDFALHKNDPSNRKYTVASSRVVALPHTK